MKSVLLVVVAVLLSASVYAGGKGHGTVLLVSNAEGNAYAAESNDHVEVIKILYNFNSSREYKLTCAQECNAVKCLKGVMDGDDCICSDCLPTSIGAGN